jgi:hypothetical protein
VLNTPWFVENRIGRRLELLSMQTSLGGGCSTKTGNSRCAEITDRIDGCSSTALNAAENA